MRATATDGLGFDFGLERVLDGIEVFIRDRGDHAQVYGDRATGIDTAT